MKLLLSFIITLWTFSVFGGAIDYRSLRQDQFTTNIPSPGYVGILGSGLTNISATNVNISAGGSIIFTTNGANISISTTGTGQATNVALIAGTNIVIQTNGAGTWTINGSLNTNIVNSLITNGILNNPQFTTNVVTTNTPAGVTNFVNSQITNQTTTAAFTNQIQSIATNVANNSFSNQIPSFIHGRTNYIALFNPNTNEVSASIMFQTNGTTDIGIRNGDSPDGSLAISEKIYGHQVSDAARDWLDFKWSVANGDYEIMTDKGSSGVLRQLTFGISGQRLWAIKTGGHFQPIDNNVYDIGQHSDTVRTLYLGTGLSFDNTGVAGVAQIANATTPGSGINFQGARIGLVDTQNAVDIMRFELQSVTPPSRTIADFGAAIIAVGTAAGSRNSWLGQDQLHTGNRWMFGTNNTAAGAPASNSIIASAGNGNNIPGGDLVIAGGPSTGSGASGTLYLGSGGSGAATSTLNTITNRMEIAPVTGTVTIYSNLVVNGTITGTLTGGQTPWASDINGANFSLTNVSSVLTTNLQVSGSGANFVNALNVSSNLWVTNGYFGLDTTAELRMTNNAGTTGQNLISAGPGLSPYWGPGGGTVTSVDVAGPAGITSSGGPITGSGTITLSTPGLLVTNGFTPALTLAGAVTHSSVQTNVGILVEKDEILVTGNGLSSTIRSNAITVTGVGAGVIDSYDSTGTNYWEFHANQNMATNVVWIGPTNVATGLVYGTNQLTGNSTNVQLMQISDGAANTVLSMQNSIPTWTPYVVSFVTASGASIFSTSTRFMAFGGGNANLSSDAAAAMTVYPFAFTITNTCTRWTNLGANTNANVVLYTNGVASNYSNSVVGAGAPISGTNTSGFRVPAGATLSWGFIGNNASAYAGNVGVSTQILQ